MNKEIYKKVFELKQHIGKVSKDSTNPFHSSKYFDINKLLEVVEPLLQERQILLLQPIIDGVVLTRLIDLESEGTIESGVKLPELSDPQKLGSCITYYRRYALKSMLGIQEEDDDGNKATKQPMVKKQEPKQPATTKLLTQKDIEKWNGKIYKNNVVYIDNIPFSVSQEQIDKMKLLPIYKPQQP